MAQWHTVNIPLLLVAAVISTALALHVGRRIAASGAAMFMLLMLAVAVWSLGYALQLGSATYPAKLFWTQLQYVGVVAVPGTWLAFVLQYTGQSRWLTRRNVALLLVEPLIVTSLVWTNRAHHLMWADAPIVAIEGGLGVLPVTYGPALWMHTAYSWLVLLLGGALLVPRLIRSPRLRRRQAAALLAGLLIPWMGNVLSTLGLIPFALDVTPLGLAAGGLLVAWALYRLRLFDIVPVAHDAVLESITDGVFVVDARGRVVDLNPAARRMIGRAAPRATGEPIGSVLPGYADVVDGEGASAEAEGRLCGEIVLWVRPQERSDPPGAGGQGGEAHGPSEVQRHFEVRTSPLYARRGRLTGRLVILHDITERHRQRVLYRVLQAIAGQLTPDAVMQTALSSISQFAGWSNAIIALPGADGTGWTVRAAGGALSFAAGQEYTVGQGIVGRALRTGVTQLVPEARLDADHIEVHRATESVLAVPFKSGDRVLGVLAIESERPAAFGEEDVRLAGSLADAIALTMDNARLFQATVNERQRLLTLIESSRDGILLVGLDKRMLVVNAPALDMLGLSGVPDVWTGRSIRDALDALARHAASSAHTIWAEMKRSHAGDEPTGEGEFEVFPRSIRWLNLPVSVDGGPLGRLLVLRDVTEEKLLAKMREDLTHTMVHDLRNPLTGISTALQLLDSKLVDVITPAQHRLFEIATNSTQRMVDLVNSILDLSRLETGKMPLNRAPVLLPDLVAETLRLQSPLYTSKQLRLESEISPTLPLAWADAEVIERVLQNLVGNAIKFTPAGGTITVAATEQVGQPPTGQGNPDPPCSHLQVSVTDSGPGVAPELREKLFEKFVVGEQPERGSGLGLAFCKLAVEAHGGEIWVESRTGEGATFAFTLPVFQEDEMIESV